jgi:hypothetical protein
LPGEAKLSMEIPVKAGHAPQRDIAKGLPVRPAGSVSARYDGDRIVLTAPGAPSFFFPAEPGVIEAAEPQRSHGGTLRLVPVKTRKEAVRVLRGVLSFEGGPAWEVEVPVEPAAPARSRRTWIWGTIVVLVAAGMLLRRKKERTS